jgi:hypothetical protein
VKLWLVLFKLHRSVVMNWRNCLESSREKKQKLTLQAHFIFVPSHTDTVIYYRNPPPVLFSYPVFIKYSGRKLIDQNNSCYHRKPSFECLLVCQNKSVMCHYNVIDRMQRKKTRKREACKVEVQWSVVFLRNACMQGLWICMSIACIYWKIHQWYVCKWDAS